ncbi:MAG: Ni/Fe hydrogenase, partial [Thauera sp.]|nr:Ni/Fe hydrogenase [Thauera sp.]
RLAPQRDASFTTHAMSPEAVLQVYADTQEGEAPSAWLLGIRGEQWALGEAPTRGALRNLEAAVSWTRAWLASG